MLSGIRTEDARAPRWREVDPDAGTVAVDRSVRRTGDQDGQAAGLARSWSLGQL